MSSSASDAVERSALRKLAHLLLPQSLKRLITGRPLLARLLGNSAWQIGDSVFRMGTGVVVSAYVARYLGPSGFGLINLGVALFTLFTAVAQFGMNSLVVRDLVAARPGSGRRYSAVPCCCESWRVSQPYCSRWGHRLCCSPAMPARRS